MDLILIPLLITVSSLFIWGVHAVFQDGYILGGAGCFFRGNLPEWLTKMMVDCTICMSSIWSPVVMFLVIQSPNWQFWILNWVGTAGLNFIIKEYLYPEQE